MSARAHASRWRRVIVAALATTALAGCGSESQPWNADRAGDASGVSVAPAATVGPADAQRPATPGRAPSPAGTSPDGTVIGTTAPDDAPAAVQQDRAAMLLLRTAVSVVEGCKSGRQTYEACDEQRELGARDRLGVIFADGDVGTVKITATPQSVRMTTRAASGTRFTVARSSGGDRFSCLAGPVRGACPPNGVWGW